MEPKSARPRVRSRPARADEAEWVAGGRLAPLRACKSNAVILPMRLERWPSARDMSARPRSRRCDERREG